MIDAFEGVLDDNLPPGTDNLPSQHEVEVGDEVEVHITVEGMGETWWEYFSAFIGVVTARWKCHEGIRWAIVKIVRRVEDTKGARPSDYLDCLFLARPCSPKDCYVFRVMCAADAKAEGVVHTVQGDIEALRDLEYMDQWRASLK